MTLPAVRFTDEHASSDERQTLEDDLDLRPTNSQFLIDQPVCVRAGPLAGLRGVTDDQAPDGRWIIRLIDAEPGVYLCIESDLLVYG
jgi:hypothetical protein